MSRLTAAIILPPADAPGGHPEPEDLARLAEGRVTGPERAALLEHVLVCGRCHEIVAETLADLAQDEGEKEIEAEATAAKAKSGWRRYALAASVAAVVVLGAGLYFHKPVGPLQQVASLPSSTQETDGTGTTRPAQPVPPTPAQPDQAQAPTASPQVPATPQPAPPQAMLATLPLDEDLRSVLVEDDSTRWTDPDRIKRLVEILSRKGVAVGPVKEVLLAAAYQPPKSLFGPEEKLKVEVREGRLRLEVVEEESGKR